MVLYNDEVCVDQMFTMGPSDTLDITRTLQMAAFGLIILGTAQHLWFNFMGKLLPKRDVVSTVKKLLIGNLVYAPLINSAFFAFNAGLQGLVKLRRDVRKCEYNDVHILWDMLKKNETVDAAKSHCGRKKVRFWDIINWAKRAPFICRSV
ncbi:putative transcription initiation factor TFIID subunit 4b-like [Capsicum annuum]|nr:putative transcription initiation factor TFIID subunit 4b-like [Capsicum annuum]